MDKDSRSSRPSHKDDDLEDLGKALAGLATTLLVIYLVRRIPWLVHVLMVIGVLYLLWSAYLLYKWLYPKV